MKNATRQRPGSNILKGLVAGIVGGAIASIAMNRFQAQWAQRGRVDRSHGAQSLQQGSPRRGIAHRLRRRGTDREKDDATERLSSAIAQEVLHGRLRERGKDIAGTAVHYAFGMTAGGLYGAAAELFPQVSSGGGLAFGAAVWFAADEGVVPALGLSKASSGYSLRTHAYALASHLVYGLTAEALRRAARAIL